MTSIIFSRINDSIIMISTNYSSTSFSSSDATCHCCIEKLTNNHIVASSETALQPATTPNREEKKTMKVKREKWCDVVCLLFYGLRDVQFFLVMLRQFRNNIICTFSCMHDATCRYAWGESSNFWNDSIVTFAYCTVQRWYSMWHESPFFINLCLTNEVTNVILIDINLVPYESHATCNGLT